MRIYQVIDRFFWVFLFFGFILGLILPAESDRFLGLLKPLIMIIMSLVFLKTDLIHVIREIKNYKLIIYLVVAYMIIIPMVFFTFANYFDEQMAIGILLLTAMPAAVASPAITDILNGNTPLSISITITTSIAAPFTIPIIFGLLNFNDLTINPWKIFLDLVFMVFVPMLLSQMLRSKFSKEIQKRKYLITPINIFILSVMVYIVIGSHQKSIVSMSEDIVIKISLLYATFIILHFLGYLLGYWQKRENRISICVGLSYMNNGLAIVLAASYFDPQIVLFMVLSEIPWNTLIVPFRKVLTFI